MARVANARQRCVILKSGKDFVISNLLVQNLNEVIERIKGVNVLKRHRVFASPSLESNRQL